MSSKQVSETEETVSKETICHWLTCSSSHPSPVPHAPPPGPPHPVGVPTQPLPAKPFRHHHRCPAAWCIPVDLIGANAVTPTYPAKSWFPTLGPKPLQGELLHHINPPLPLLERIRGNLQSKRHGSIICIFSLRHSTPLQKSSIRMKSHLQLTLQMGLYLQGVWKQQVPHANRAPILLHFDASKQDVSSLKGEARCDGGPFV